MDKQYFFERNLLALSRRNPELCSRLSGAQTTLGRYRFLEARSGDIIPAWVDPSGSAHPLHSLVDPRREAKRLVDSVNDEGFLILLGLGGGFCAEAALEREGTSLVLVIDYDIDSLAELLCSKDYIRIFQDPRFHLLADPKCPALEEYILGIYQPVLAGGIRTLPLRVRTASGAASFAGAAAAVESAVERIAADYSVQAYFGTRWFSNIIRNLEQAEKNEGPLEPVRQAAVAAAGPSLNTQMPLIREKRGSLFLIAADTALPALLAGGVTPDAVVSIDCQHISCYHFMGGLPGEVLLFLDLASPPLIASRSCSPRFFSGGHPLTRYISRSWRSLPEVDTSGANVTYAALSLAEKLGAKTIELYGADFSYPLGASYARGTYIHPYFEIQQNRLAPLEALFSAFLYRSPLEKKSGNAGSWYYETRSLKLYRESLEAKSRSMQAAILPAAGLGAPILVPVKTAGAPFPAPGSLSLFAPGPASMKAADFLARYRDRIRLLPVPEKGAAYPWGMEGEEPAVLATLLPAAAAIKRRNPDLETREILERVKSYCIEQLDLVLQHKSGIW
jgi:hypothetical protein